MLYFFITLRSFVIYNDRRNLLFDSNLHWLPIRKRIDCKLCLLAHNVRIGHAPQYLTEFLTATSDVPSKASLRSSNSDDFVVPATRLRLGDRGFSVAAARAWNMLPTQLKSTHDTSTFKRKLKTFWLHLYRLISCSANRFLWLCNAPSVYSRRRTINDCWTCTWTWYAV